MSLSERFRSVLAATLARAGANLLRASGAVLSEAPETAPDDDDEDSSVSHVVALSPKARTMLAEGQELTKRPTAPRPERVLRGSLADRANRGDK